MSGMKRLKNRRTGVLVSFTRLRHVTRPISVRTPPLVSDRDFLRIEAAQDLEQGRTAVGRVGAHALIEDRRATHAGDHPGNLERPIPALLERLISRDADRDDVRADRGLQLRGTPLGHDLALIDDRDALAQLIGFFHVLGREEDRHLLFLVQAAQVLPHRVPRLRIEARRRFVEEEDARVMHEARAEVEPPPHPAGVGVGAPIGGILQLQDVQELLDSLLHERLGHMVEPPDQPEIFSAREFAIDAD